MLQFFRRCRVLSNLQRCAHVNKTKSYSVADHSYYCAMLAMVLCDYQNDLWRSGKFEGHGRFLDRDKVICRLLLHDLPEALTGDILFPIKHYDNSISQAIKKVEDELTKTRLFVELPDEISKSYKSRILCAKDSSLEGSMVAAIDKLEVLLFAVEELEMGNGAFWHIYDSALEIIGKHKYYGFESIEVLVKEVEKFVIMLT